MLGNNRNFKWSFVGNPQITDYLEKKIKSGNAGGSYIFNGPDNFGKTGLALNFAQILLCDNLNKEGNIPCGVCHSCRQFLHQNEENDAAHGDLHLIKKEKDKRDINIKQIREFIKILSMSSFLGKYKIGIIKHAEFLNKEAANALLKTLEEPRKDVVIILITNDFEHLPRTIASRSQIFNFYPLKADDIYDYLVYNYKVPRSKAKHLARLSLGRPALALKFLEDEDFFEKYKKHVLLFLDLKKNSLEKRISMLDDLFSISKNEKVKIREVFRVLEVWQGIMRDWIFMEFSHFNLIQHEIFLEKLEEAKKFYSLEEILKLASFFKEAFENLKANVNPKLVLEELVIKI